MCPSIEALLCLGNQFIAVKGVRKYYKHIGIVNIYFSHEFNYLSTDWGNYGGSIACLLAACNDC